MLVLIAALLLAGHPAFAHDWPQWGGLSPGRNMYSPAKGLPERFDPGKFRPRTEEVDLATTKNVKWIAKLGSQSYGNPTVAGGRVFVGTNNDVPRDPRHRGDRSILLCLDEKTGELQWQLVAPKLKAGRANDWERLGMISSPAVAGDRLYLVTSRAEVLCLDVAGMANGNDGPFKDEAQYVVQDTDQPPVEPGPKDADIIWRYDMIDELGAFPHNASDCSPLLFAGRLYVCTGNGQDWTHLNVPFPFAPSLIALDPKTGTLAGEDDAQIGPRVFHGQWGSPSAGVVNGRPLVFFGAGDGVLYAFDAKPAAENGANYLKKVWWFDCVPPEYKVKDGEPIKYPAPEGPSEIVATPVFFSNRVYVALGQDPEHGDGVGRLVCVDATKSGDVTTSAAVWSCKDIHRSLSTVGIDPDSGLLFTADFAGFVYCLEADTGKLNWTHDMKANVWGSTLVADGKLYVVDEDGDLAILAARREKKLLSEANLGAPAHSTPIVANGVIYAATASHLYAIHNAAQQAK
jgi:outer membrane protein assembly factor BamB